MSYTRKLLFSIGEQMGRSHKDMEPFIQTLEKNWYDTRQALQTLTVQDYDRFDIPRRLSGIIIEKVGGGQNKQAKKFSADSSMDVQFSVQSSLNFIKNKLTPEQFNFCIDTMIKILRNIRDNLTQQKYRTLKKSNKKIGDLLSVPECAQILNYAGFEDSSQIIMMKQINLGRIDQCLDGVMKFDEKNKFNPYQAEFMTTRGEKKIEGESSVIFNDKLKQLEKQREMMMSKPIKDRNIKIYRQESKGEFKADSNWNQERELNADERMFSENMRDKLKSFGDDPKFMNRRKLEYLQLAKKPCFDQTLIRVKLPDRYVFEAIFSPLETFGDLVNVFHEFVENKNLDYYLYMTPPVEKLKGQILRQTFYEKDCVPSGLFYFGSEQQIPGDKILKMKKSGFMGFFN